MSGRIELNQPFGNLKPSSTLYINEEVNRLWQAGESVYHLGFGESRFAVHPKLQQALAQAADRKSYLPACGLESLRQTVAAHYSRQLDLKFSPHQVMIGPGSKALIYALQMALDADLYLPSPSWVSYAPQARLLGKPVHYIPSSAAADYAFDLKAFDALLQNSAKSQKLLIINSPNNPTGEMYSETLLRELAAYCRDNQVLVISDEIYSRLQHGPAEHISIAKHYPEGSFVLGGLSKHLSLGGWRLGIGIVPDTTSGAGVMAALRAIASETWSSVSAPVQYAAIAAYSDDPEIEAYVQKCCAIHGIRSRYLHRRLQALGIRCTRPQGAFYLTANFDHWSEGLARAGIDSSDDLARHLLQQHRIATLATDSFGLPPEVLSLRLATSYLDMESSADSERLLRLYDSGVDEDAFMSPEHHPNTHACVQAFAAFVDWLGG